MKLEEGLARVAEVLSRRGIRFALAGGFAFSAYVTPRATEDIDLVLFVDDIEALAAALRNIFQSVYVNTESMEYPLVRLKRLLGIQGDQEIVIDALDIRSSEWREEVLRRAGTLSVSGARLPIVSKEDLYLLKQASNRPRDAADCEELAKLPGFDTAYVERWKEDLSLI
jgi:predicted nucleotidyltransferase